jgi:hypothetical protein
MNGHLSTDEIHDLLDGLLEASEEERLSRHVESCARCRGETEALAAVLAGMAELPREAEPARDLWGGIEARIAGTTPGAPEPVVIEFPGSVAAAAAVRRRVSLSLPQLYAAGIAIALLSGAAVWYALGRTAPGATMGLDAPDAPVALVSRTDAAGAELDEAVFQLEHALQEGRELLSPETLATIEQSLSAIDTAIAEARAALQNDPASPLLNRLLVSHQKNKLRILRQATSRLLPSA